MRTVKLSWNPKVRGEHKKMFELPPPSDKFPWLNGRYIYPRDPGSPFQRMMNGCPITSEMKPPRSYQFQPNKNPKSHIPTAHLHVDCATSDGPLPKNPHLFPCVTAMTATEGTFACSNLRAFFTLMLAALLWVENVSGRLLEGVPGTYQSY